jgi:hypothetical protein
VEGFARRQFDVVELGAWPDVISHLGNLGGTRVAVGDGPGRLAFSSGRTTAAAIRLLVASFRRRFPPSIGRRWLPRVLGEQRGLSSFLDLSPASGGWDRYAQPRVGRVLLRTPAGLQHCIAGRGRPDATTSAGRCAPKRDLAEQMLDAAGFDARLTIGRPVLRLHLQSRRRAWAGARNAGGLSGQVRARLGLAACAIGATTSAGFAVSGYRRSSIDDSPSNAATAARESREMRETVDRDRLVELAVEA